MRKSLSSIAVILPAAAVLLAGPTSAAAHKVERQVTVTYVDLDLGDPDDVARLSSRVVQALARVCDTSVNRPLYELIDQRACLAQASAEVMPRVEGAIAAARARRAEAIARETLAQASTSSFPRR